MPEDESPEYTEGREQQERGENNTNPHDSRSIQGADRNDGFNDAEEAAKTQE